MKLNIPQMPPVEYDTFIMQGGVDQITPLLALKNGTLRDALNFEAGILGGYSRIAGYERCDGQKLPSSNSWAPLYIQAFSYVPAVGDTVTGATSGAAAYVLYVSTNYLVVTDEVGTFQLNETIKDGLNTVGTFVSANTTITSLQDVTYFSLAADRQRSKIGVVPGSGNIRGVFVYNDVVYAWRDNAGATACALYKQTSTGWQLVPFTYEIYFTAGTTQPAEGAVLSQGGVTATIQRVATEGGVWGSGTAHGRFIITSIAGGNFAAGAATATGGTTVTLSGVQTAITFQPGGRYEVVIGNFSGQSTTKRAYGTDGVNRCWEFDGTIMVPINTYSTPDNPKHIAIHKNYLFCTIASSLVFSGPGKQYDFAAIDGAGEIATGDDVTNLLELPGEQTTAAMAVTTRTTMGVLYGTDQNSWNLVPLNVGTGAIGYTAQNMQHSYFFDDRGVLDLQETLNYGNFNVNTITFPVNNFIIQKRTKVTGCALNRQKSQYRLFFSDGSGLYITNVHGQYSWMNVTSYNMFVSFPDPVLVVFNSKISTGDEVTYFGSSSGYVFKMDSGTSFDGAAINAYLTLAPDQVSSPRTLKRMRHAWLEIIANSYMQLTFGYTLGYNATNILQAGTAIYSNDFSLPFWDSFTWDNFTWDGSTNNPSTECEMQGTAENYALILSSNSKLFQPFSINSVIAHYTRRRGKR